MRALLLILISFFALGFSCVAAPEAPEVIDTSSIYDLEYEKKIDNPCLDQDVWVFVKHRDPWDPTCTVIVHVPKHSLGGDAINCPAQDTKVVGEGRMNGQFAGFHVVTLKKGILNNPKNYVTKKPKHIKIPANNFNLRHISY